MSFAQVTIITGIAAALCLPVLIFWAFGIPGQPSSHSSYTKGWTTGLTVLVHYPLVWLLVYVPYFVLGRFIPALGGAGWQNGVALFMLAASVVAAIAMLFAFVMIFMD